jgi:hypothetical protein
LSILPDVPSGRTSERQQTGFFDDGASPNKAIQYYRSVSEKKRMNEKPVESTVTTTPVSGNW